MGSLLLKLFWFILPAGVANITASVSRFFIPWNYPVDCFKKWRGKRIFGDHKTWRGMIVGTILGTVFYLLQFFLFFFEPFAEISILEYNEYPWYFGALLSFGALFGDLIKSFVKRRAEIPPGAPWVPFDQIDYILGALFLGSILYFPGWAEAALLIIGGFFFHLLFNRSAYWLGLQKNKW